VCEADFTPLMFCAYHGHALVAEVLIEAGCDVNASASVRYVVISAISVNEDRKYKFNKSLKRLIGENFC